MDTDNIPIIAIAALGKNTRDICYENELLWRISDDLKKVKEETAGYPIIMGRKTHQSIGKPLPNRYNIILTRNKENSQVKEDNDISLAATIDEALELAKSWCHRNGKNKIFIFGGAEIYKLALPYTDTLMLTLVQSDKHGTAKFPEYEKEFDLIDESSEQFDEKENVKYTRAIFARKDSSVQKKSEAIMVSHMSG